jgi:uncharacterized 2Fe-2S/4Fe-4S cluster protein (DUF4445 family)
MRWGEQAVGMSEGTPSSSPNSEHDAGSGPVFRVILLPSGRQGSIGAETDLLAAARRLGVELESICGGRQTCGKCQVIVEEGSFAKHGVRSHVDHLSAITEQEEAYFRSHGIAGRRLACAARVLGDVLITVPEESQARKQIIAKAATDRVMEVNPAVRQLYVEVQQPDLGSGGSDWGRLQQALETQWDLREVRIDLKALTGLQAALRQGSHKLTVTVWQDREILRVQPGYLEGLYGLAVDVGSTTIVAHLCDLRTGKVLATEAMMNPQVRYGEDLMSRVSYGMTEPQGVERMHRAVIRAINELAAKAVQAAGMKTDDIIDAVVVGNTIMHHLFLGIDPMELGGAPFALAASQSLDSKARDLGLAFHPGAYVHTLPCIAGHVGADHVAVLLAEVPHQQDELMLVVDVGTNAEMSLGNRGRLVCASSPTGPAFEGAQIAHGQRAAPGAIERVRIDPTTLEIRWKVIGEERWVKAGEVPEAPGQRATGICGSGIIEAVAEMFLAGIVDAHGGFREEASASTSRVRFKGRIGELVLAEVGQTATDTEIVITQNDVRAIQLAKGALYAGVKLLMKESGVPKVDRVVLAGAFGSYISPRHAMILGMIPDCDLERVHAVGNAAGDGARLALLNHAQRAEAERLARQVEHVQTATASTFQDEFVAALGIPHASDPFPHLQGVIPAPSSGQAHRRRARRPQGRSS